MLFVRREELARVGLEEKARQQGGRCGAPPWLAQIRTCVPMHAVEIAKRQHGVFASGGTELEPLTMSMSCSLVRGEVFARASRAGRLGTMSWPPVRTALPFTAHTVLELRALLFRNELDERVKGHHRIADLDGRLEGQRLGDVNLLQGPGASCRTRQR